MKEVELKFKVDLLDIIMDILKKYGCEFSDVLDQKDTIFVPDLLNTESVENSIWLRVREENNRVELNYKKQSSKKMQSKEIELEVSSSNDAKKLLEELGFKKWVEVHKKRRTTKYKKYNICIDEVERLGSFIEIELLVPEIDTNDYEKELYDVALELGITKDKRINSHYDTMIKELGD